MEIEKKIIKERFELLYREIFFAKQQYMIFDMIIRKCIDSDNYKEIIIANIEALETSIIMKLAKIYDEDKDSITLYYMLNTIQSLKIINKNDKLIIQYAVEKLEKLRKIQAQYKIKLARDKNIAHLDKEYYLGLKSINAKDIISLVDLKELIGFAYDTIKETFMKIYKEEILEQKKFEIIELQANSIIDEVNKYFEF